MSRGTSTISHATVADALIAAFRAAGARRIFGLPGGGSSLDVIEAARGAGIEFVLARHECSAVFMASAAAELDGSLGVALTTKGPGTANATNGIAHAALDRCAVAVVTDGFSPTLRSYVTHQWYDQRALLAPLVKAHSTLDGGDVAGEIRRLIDTARSPRRGPVHIELTGAIARAAVDASSAPGAAVPDACHAGAADARTIERAREMLRSARFPVVVAGLESREAGVAAALRPLVDRLGCAALVTYKAKGVIADSTPQFVGIFTGGAAEQSTVRNADLIVLVGVDPVELILQPWAYDIPVLDIGCTRHPVHYVEPVLGVYGDLAANLSVLADGLGRCEWEHRRIASLRDAMRRSLAYSGSGIGPTPQQVVEVAADESSRLEKWPRATVDAGAHMFSATAFWPCESPGDLLISNGLATMGFAVPAAIASSLHDPRRTTIAFTGDGGLLMCLGELATAIETRARLVVVVFNDGALSLIDIKQQQRGLPVSGVRWERPDFSGVMRSLGGRGYRADSISAYRDALSQALAGVGPALVDVAVDPSGYPGQLEAMRG